MVGKERFKVRIKESIVKQPDVRYIPPDVIGIELLIDFSKLTEDDKPFLKTVLPHNENIVASNAVVTWVKPAEVMSLKLYNPKEHIVNLEIPAGVQKKNICLTN